MGPFLPLQLDYLNVGGTRIADERSGFKLFKELADTRPWPVALLGEVMRQLVVDICNDIQYRRPYLLELSRLFPRLANVIPFRVFPIRCSPSSIPPMFSYRRLVCRTATSWCTLRRFTTTTSSSDSPPPRKRSKQNKRRTSVPFVEIDSAGF
ncbi:hypothetical protein OUZ56_031843 [Daphnia magna]|uniref:Uncharacterized protein n=1 Tax=Daphnia magna TaxID=35525 RepID=A0ABQ9ZVD0_9CRUS|nr:hypothetical protein OUZ56_031843 [Daphnia magna]